jgi:hypothetical protein
MSPEISSRPRNISANRERLRVHGRILPGEKTRNLAQRIVAA